MGRRAALVALVLLTAASTAGATTRVHATLTRAIPAHAPTGEHVRISWRLRDAAGRAVAVRHVFVQVVCPEGTDSTFADAVRGANGVYTAVAVVPPGGIGTVTIRTRSATFPITNLHRS